MSFCFPYVIHALSITDVNSGCVLIKVSYMHLVVGLEKTLEDQLKNMTLELMNGLFKQKCQNLGLGKLSSLSGIYYQ